jgi:hypothetical protein
MTTVNHYGKWVDSDMPVTGVLSVHDVEWEWINDEICITCKSIQKEIESDESMDEDKKEEELEFLECDSSHEKIMGNWLQDKQGKYYPNPNGEYAAIINETTIQVVYSKFTARGPLCSPCYPGQVDLNHNSNDSTGEFIGYTLPKELLREE